MIQQRRQELTTQRIDIAFSQEDVTQDLSTYTADSSRVIVNNDLIINESSALT